jgi:plastocyanin
VKRALCLALLALAIPGASSAAPATQPVNIQFQDFGPNQLDVLPGETVQWSNVSERTHTVTADDDSFDSGDLQGGDTFTREFDSPALIPYHCTKHAGMVGEIDVRPVILAPLPTAAVPAGDQIEFDGRTADPSQPVRVELSTGGSFRTVASAQPAADGTWKVSAAAQASGDYRAANDGGVSETRHVLVSDRKVLVRATRHGVAVTVIPALPYAHVVLQEDLRARFGWWPAISTRLDYVSQASFKVARPARVRVVLVGKDGWTPLATSPVLSLGHLKRSHTAPPMPMH